MPARLEHINVSVPDCHATAVVLSKLFGWEVRWQGETPGKGHSVHVGSKDSYIALYSPGHEMLADVPKYRHYGGLNHIGLVVEDLDAAEAKVRREGYAPHMHADYEPGRRFYFNGPDGVEYELVSYKT